MTVCKRTGKIEKLSKRKIFNSISNANISVEENVRLTQKQITDITDSIVTFCLSQTEPIDIDVLEDIIEKKLMESGGYDVAKRYIKYRYEKERARTFKNLTEKLMAENVQNQNANMDESSFSGRMGEASSYMTKDYALNNLISKKSRQNHINNEIYIHDLDHYALGDHNCFLGSTKFITKDGIKRFDEYRDNDRVEVLDKDGVWRMATVRYYGRQPMHEIVLSRQYKQVRISCTKNHRWILNDGSITENISVGDRLSLLQEIKDNLEIESKRDAEMFSLGFIIGDGTDSNQGQLWCRLCGDKEQYKDIFSKAGYRITRWSKDQYMMCTKSVSYKKQDFLTHRMWRILSFRDKQMLFRGYYCADGFKTTSTKQCMTSDERVLDMIKETSYTNGYHIHNIKKEVHSTNYKENAESYLISFTNHHTDNSAWKVIDIKTKKNKDYACWCVEEPVTHSFTLECGIITGNCLSIPFDKLLANGFNTRQTDVRPANSVNTAFQLVAVLFQLQSLQQFGGVAATHLDWTMVPYVRLSFNKHYLDGLKYIDNVEIKYYESRDTITSTSIDDTKLYSYEKSRNYALEQTKRELKQAVEGMYHNLNTLQSRSGGQLPFTSINYGTCTSTEGRMVIRALIEGCMEGVGEYNRTAIFPCGIFQSAKGINQRPGDPNYDLFKLALECTSKRIYPNYANIDWSGNAGYDPENPCTFFSTMGCRTANGLDINQDDPKLAQLKDGRGNISPVTIILPTLAMEAHDKVYPSPIKENDYDPAKVIPEFMKLLDRKINEARDMLLERFDWQCSQPADSAKFMYENELMYGYKKEEGIKSALKHGTIVIGQLGLAEALQILIGKDQTTEEGMKLAVEIETLFKTKCAKFKKDYKLNFGVYYTPAENLCFTAMKKFKEKYGEIPNISDHEFFTNSIHVPVWNKMNAFQKIDIESKLTGYSNAGCITYVELDGEASKNLKALEELVLYAMEKDIPYFAINVPINDCLDCGYSDSKIKDTCPKCGSHNINQLRRVTGYLSTTYKHFNLGKQNEVEERVKHTGIEIKEKV